MWVGNRFTKFPLVNPPWYKPLSAYRDRVDAHEAASLRSMRTGHYAANIRGVRISIVKGRSVRRVRA